MPKASEGLSRTRMMSTEATLPLPPLGSSTIVGAGIDRFTAIGLTMGGRDTAGLVAPTVPAFLFDVAMAAAMAFFRARRA